MSEYLTLWDSAQRFAYPRVNVAEVVAVCLDTASLVDNQKMFDCEATAHHTLLVAFILKNVKGQGYSKLTSCS